jgi:hypothetical protein
VVTRKYLPDATLIGLAAGATCLVVIVFAMSESFAPRQAFVRYIAPMSGGLTIFFVCEAIRSADARRREPTARHRWAPAITIAAAIGLAAIGFSSLGVSLEYEVTPAGATLISRAARNDLLPTLPGLEAEPPAYVPAYERALSRVDPDTTIASVDRPHLIDYRRYDIPSLDFPGFTAPGGEFPFFTGPGPKIERLRRAGYTTLLASVPDTEACFRPAVLRAQRLFRIRNYSYYARYYLDFQDDITAIAAEAPDAVRKFGPLLVIDLDRAQRDLAASPPPA